MKIEHLDNSSLEVVFKIQETCNINCSYCYMYNMGNEAHLLVPQQQASDAVWLDVADFIVEENKRRDPKYVRIVLHGGEPLLIKTRIFARRMSAFWERLSEGLTDRQLERVEFSLQTNGMLVTDDWIEQLKRWNISTGVSLDGPAAVHDRQRVDKKGQGTHERTIVGIRKLQADPQVKERGLGYLCVIDHQADGAEVYKYLAEMSGKSGFSLLLPFMNWDNYDPDVVSGVGAFLVAAFREWTREIERGFFRNVRIFREAIDSLTCPVPESWQDDVKVGHDVIVVECDGTIMTEESLRPTFSGMFSELRAGQVSLEDIRQSPQYQQVAMDTYALSEECDGCALKLSCRSGGAIGRVGFRYSSGDEKMRKSVYCEAFIDLYIEVAAFLDINRLKVPALENRELDPLG